MFIIGFTRRTRANYLEKLTEKLSKIFKSIRCIVETVSKTISDRIFINKIYQ